MKSKQSKEINEHLRKSMQMKGNQRRPKEVTTEGAQRKIKMSRSCDVNNPESIRKATCLQGQGKLRRAPRPQMVLRRCAIVGNPSLSET